MFLNYSVTVGSHFRTCFIPSLLTPQNCLHPNVSSIQRTQEGGTPPHCSWGYGCVRAPSPTEPPAEKDQCLTITNQTLILTPWGDGCDTETPEVRNSPRRAPQKSSDSGRVEVRSRPPLTLVHPPLPLGGEPTSQRTGGGVRPDPPTRLVPPALGGDQSYKEVCPDRRTCQLREGQERRVSAPISFMVAALSRSVPFGSSSWGRGGGRALVVANGNAEINADVVAKDRYHTEGGLKIKIAKLFSKNGPK